MKCILSKHVIYFREKGLMIMALSITGKHKISFDTEDINVRNMVIAGFEQIQSNNTKDFNEVCDRLEKKYMNATIHN